MDGAGCLIRLVFFSYVFLNYVSHNEPDKKYIGVNKGRGLHSSPRDHLRWPLRLIKTRMWVWEVYYSIRLYRSKSSDQPVKSDPPQLLKVVKRAGARGRQKAGPQQTNGCDLGATGEGPRLLLRRGWKQKALEWLGCRNKCGVKDSVNRPKYLQLGGGGPTKLASSAGPPANTGKPALLCSPPPSSTQNYSQTGNFHSYL